MADGGHMDIVMWDVTGVQWAMLAGLIVLCNVVGVGAALATASSVRDWYPTLRKPSWTPPSWLFGPAWTVLYILMATAAWRVWMAADGFAGAPLALTLFFVQLPTNRAGRRPERRRLAPLHRRPGAAIR